MKPTLSLDDLKREAIAFASDMAATPNPVLFGVTDGKTIGTYVEGRFKDHLLAAFDFQRGSSATGIDFPDLGVDLKVTSASQPQSSCPYRSAEQKVFGLGYSLLVFVYDKRDDHRTHTARLDVQHIVFISKESTGDFQTTSGIRRILDNHGNRDDLLAFLEELRLPVDETGAAMIADRLLREQVPIGYLTISSALQWRLQYARALQEAGRAPGLLRLK